MLINSIIFIINAFISIIKLYTDKYNKDYYAKLLFLSLLCIGATYFALHSEFTLIFCLTIYIIYGLL